MKKTPFKQQLATPKSSRSILLTAVIHTLIFFALLSASNHLLTWIGIPMSNAFNIARTIVIILIATIIAYQYFTKRHQRNFSLREYRRLIAAVVVLQTVINVLITGYYLILIIKDSTPQEQTLLFGIFISSVALASLVAWLATWWSLRLTIRAFYRREETAVAENLG